MNPQIDASQPTGVNLVFALPAQWQAAVRSARRRGRR